jgi:RNA polymerase sigma factor (sigma-70 family)
LRCGTASAHVTQTLLPRHQPADRQLIEAAQRGDRDAYAALVSRHQHIAFRAAYLICGSAADAEDVGQDAFVKASLALHRFRPSSPFRPWLIRIVINEARNSRRTAGRRANLALRLADVGHEDAPGADAVALGDEQRARRLAAFSALREQDQLIIAARYYLDLSESETAGALGMPRGTAKSSYLNLGVAPVVHGRSDATDENVGGLMIVGRPAVSRTTRCLPCPDGCRCLAFGDAIPRMPDADRPTEGLMTARTVCITVTH